MPSRSKPRLRPPVVHIKGFASGIDVAEISRCARWLQTEIDPLATVVWDGDDFSRQSFTGVIPLLHAAMPELLFVACMYSERKPAFEESWKSTRVPIKVHTVAKNHNSPNDYATLGVAALEMTGSIQVFCIGGGSVTHEEFLRTRSMQPIPPKFHLLRVDRCKTLADNRTVQQNSTLLELDGVVMTTYGGPDHWDSRSVTPFGLVIFSLSLLSSAVLSHYLLL